MSVIDPGTQPDLPLNQNINWVQLVGFLAVVASYFGLKVPPEVQAEIATGIGAIVFVVTWILHTYVNHPKNVTAARALANAAGTQGYIQGTANGKNSAVAGRVNPPLT